MAKQHSARISLFGPVSIPKHNIRVLHIEGGRKAAPQEAKAHLHLAWCLDRVRLVEARGLQPQEPASATLVEGTLSDYNNNTEALWRK